MKQYIFCKMYVTPMDCKTNKLPIDMNSLNKFPGYPMTNSHGYSANCCRSGNLSKQQRKVQ